jgi:L-lactate dehydrogenase complex protein LldE
VNVALFITCFNDTLFPSTGRAVVRLLERLGHTVEFPLEQTCCGQMHLNSGYPDEALPLVRRFVRVFADYEVIVSPSASCVGMVREQFPHLAERASDASLSAGVAALVPRVLELSEFLVDRLGVDDVGAFFPHRVTSPDLPRASVLGSRAPAEPVACGTRHRCDLPDAGECCGFGRTFAVKTPSVGGDARRQAPLHRRHGRHLHGRRRSLT